MVNIGQSSIAKCVVRVFVDGILKVSLTLPQIIFNAFVQEIAPPKVAS